MHEIEKGGTQAEMTGQVIDMSYEAFSRVREYSEVNKLFVESLNLDSYQQILEVACGTGTLTAMLLDEMCPIHTDAHEMPEREIRVVGLDISRESLKLARKNLSERVLSDEHHVLFVQASADSLPIDALSMDAAIMGNAIHLFENKGRVVSELHRILRPGGTFAFNTSFYAGTYVQGTEHFYLRWVEEAVNYLKAKDAELKRQGLGGIRRKRGLAKAAFSRPWLAQTEYELLLSHNGFEVNSVVGRTVVLTQHAFQTIGSYAGLAGVLLSGYPIQLACEALERSVGPALTAENLEAVPRHWIEFVCSKQK